MEEVKGDRIQKKVASDRRRDIPTQQQKNKKNMLTVCLMLGIKAFIYGKFNMTKKIILTFTTE